jgi:hypothetical protein
MNWFVSEVVVTAGESADRISPLSQGSRLSYVFYSDCFNELTFSMTTTQTLY